MVSVYSVTHFFIDFACAFLMFCFIAGTTEGYLCVLLYNFCAFAMQMPIGIIADKLNRNYLFAICGCILVAVSYGLITFPIVAVIVIGIGNAMFHIGGGIDVLNISEKKLSALGIFVSPGAFGIYFGAMLGRDGLLPMIFLPLALVVAATLIFIVFKTQRGSYPENAEFSLHNAGLKAAFSAALCFFLVVCLRSYMGLAMNFSWTNIGLWGFVLICAVVFGKTLGGVFADKFGVVKTVFISLGTASLLFLFPRFPIAGIVAILLFNMTMPITLWAMAKIFPGAKGFAFGLLTFALFLGFLPVYLDFDILGGAPWLFALLSFVSLAILVTGLLRQPMRITNE